MEVSATVFTDLSSYAMLELAPSVAHIMMRFCPKRSFVAVLCVVATVSSTAPARDASQEAFSQNSLQYRTALRYNPLDRVSLTELYQLYERVDQLDGLADLYTTHLQSYPDDAGSKAVLIQILQKSDQAAAGELLARSLEEHPESGVLYRLLYETLSAKEDPRAAEALWNAILLTNDESEVRRLIQIYRDEAPDERAQSQIQALLAERLSAKSGGRENLFEWLDLARQFGYWQLISEALTDWDDFISGYSLSAEDALALRLRLTEALTQSGESDRALQEYDDLLAALAADHWQFFDISQRRIRLLQDTGKLDDLVKEWRGKWRAGEWAKAEWLAALDIFTAAGEAQEAADLLLRGLEKFSADSASEKRINAILDGKDVLQADTLEALVDWFPRHVNLRKEALVRSTTEERWPVLRQHVKTFLDDNAIADGVREEAFWQSIISRITGPEREQLIEMLSDAAEEAKNSLPLSLALARHHDGIDEREKAQAVLSALSFSEITKVEADALYQFLLSNRHWGLMSRLFEDVESRDDLSKADSVQWALKRIQLETLAGGKKDLTGVLANQRQASLTEGLYPKWLEVALGYHRISGDEQRFINQEIQSLSDALSRDDNKAIQEAALHFYGKLGLQQGYLDFGPIVELLLERIQDPELVAEIRLQRLMALEGLSFDEWAARAEEIRNVLPEREMDLVGETIVRAFSAGRQQVVTEALPRLDPLKVQTTELLIDLSEVTSSLGRHDVTEALLRELSLRQGDGSAADAALISLYAWNGEEQKLRRKLTAEIGRADDVSSGKNQRTQVLLRKLRDSYWRTLSRLLVDAAGVRNLNLSVGLSFHEMDAEEALRLSDRMLAELPVSHHESWMGWCRIAALLGSGRSREAIDAKLAFFETYPEVTRKGIPLPNGFTLFLRQEEGVDAEASAETTLEESTTRSAIPRGDLELSWLHSANRAGKGMRDFRFSEGTIWFLRSDRTYCEVDMESGKLLTRKPLPVPRDPRFWWLQNGEPVFVFDSNDKLVASDAGGDILWKVDFADASPDLFHDSTDEEQVFVVVSGGDGSRAVSVSKETGKLLWQRELGGLKRVERLELQGNQLVLCDDLGSFMGVDKSTGSLLWQLRKKDDDLSRRFPPIYQLAEASMDSGASSEQMRDGGMKQRLSPTLHGRRPLTAELAGSERFQPFRPFELIEPFDLLTDFRVMTPYTYEGGKFLLSAEGWVMESDLQLPLQAKAQPAPGDLKAVGTQDLWFQTGPQKLKVVEREDGSSFPINLEQPVAVSRVDQFICLLSSSELIVYRSGEDSAIARYPLGELLKGHLSAEIQPHGVDILKMDEAGLLIVVGEQYLINLGTIPTERVTR